MKLFLPLVVAAGLGLTIAYADPSESGLEHGQRLGWSKAPETVPDSGSTITLLAIGMASLAFWRLKLA